MCFQIWFWNVNDAPASIKSGSPNMSEFGTPKATFESSTCDMNSYFDEEQMIMYVELELFHLKLRSSFTEAETLLHFSAICSINTTLMGDWAGATFWNNGCTGTLAATVANADNFNKAYWLINSVKLYA